MKRAIEIGDRAREGRAYRNIGRAFFSLEQFDNAMDNLASSAEVFNAARCCSKSKDDWKINFRELYEETYPGLWQSLLRINKVDEALFAAEQGRAQTLSDTLLIQYKLRASLSAVTSSAKEIISRLLTDLSTPTLFLAIEGFTINIWFLRRGKKISFGQESLKGDRRDQDPIRVLQETALKEIEAEVRLICEDRTFGELENEYPSIIGVRGEKVGDPPLPPSKNPFKPLYDAVIDPIVDMLGSQDNELVIVSDGALCFTPWPAVIESIRIRTVPSLTSYQLISSVPESHHKKTGALLVGNPCVSHLEKFNPYTTYRVLKWK